MCLAFERLAGAEIVSPVLPTLLQALGERDLAATFFVDAAAVKQEPLAATMIVNARNEIAGRVAPGEPSRALDELQAAGHRPRGVSAVQIDPALVAALAARGTVRYIAAPDVPFGATSHGIVQLPIDRASASATFLAADASTPGGAPAWHQALQLAVARAIEHRTQVTLSLAPGLLERADALGVAVETLDLIAGLRRAERLWVPTLSGLAEWWAAARVASKDDGLR